VSKITVISQRGKLVGVWLPPPEVSDPQTPVSRPLAGSGQKVRDLEVGDLAMYRDASKAIELTKLVKKKLKLT
jgi:hypothetical protein